MCFPPPTVVVKSILMPELLLLAEPPLEATPLVVAPLVVAPLVLGTTLQHVSMSGLVSAIEPVVGANWGISPKTLVKSSEIITISL